MKGKKLTLSEALRNLNQKGDDLKTMYFKLLSENINLKRTLRKLERRLNNREDLNG